MNQESIIYCSFCSNRFVKIIMEKIGGWDKEGKPSSKSTWQCPKCKKVIAE